MGFNASLFRRTAEAMKANGLLEAGYALLSPGGSTYMHEGLAPRWNESDPKKYQGVIVRNATGHYQIDPNRFPGPGSSAQCLNETALEQCLKATGQPESRSTGVGCGCKNGNEGMRALSAEVRGMGFLWGSYSNMAGCQVAACDIPALNDSKHAGFVQQDYDLMFGDWQSTYVMVDAVAIQPVPPHDYWSMQKYQLGLWRDHIVNRSVSPGKVPAPKAPSILHDCHNGCGSTFKGPTFMIALCNASDPAQHWELHENNTGHPWAWHPDTLKRLGFFRDGGAGLCVGCSDGPMTGCANDAGRNASGLGSGMQACLQGFGGGSAQQRFNYSSTTKMVRRADGACLEVARGGAGPQVIVQENRAMCNSSLAHQIWSRGAAVVGAGGIARTQLRPASNSTLCLAAGPTIALPVDSWCAANNNMYRSNTDSVQQW